MKCEICGQEKKAILLFISTVYECTSCSTEKKTITTVKPSILGEWKTLEQLAYELKNQFPFNVVTPDGYQYQVIRKQTRGTLILFYVQSMRTSNIKERQGRNPIYKLI